MIRLLCPSCSKRVKVGDEAKGRSGTCPNCAAKFTVPETSTVDGDATFSPFAEIDHQEELVSFTAEPPPIPAELPAKPRSRPRADRDDDEYRRPVRRRRQEDSDDYAPRESRHGNGVALAAMILGIIAIVIAAIPCTFWVAIIISSVSLFLAMIGFFVAAFRSGIGTGQAFAAVVCSVVAFGLASIWSYMANRAVVAALQGQAGLQPEAPPVEVRPFEATKETATFGDVSVSVVAVGVGRIRLDGIRQGVSAKDSLWVQLEIRNTSKTKRATYTGWNRDFVGFRDKTGSLRDDLGNVCRRISFGIDRPVGHVEFSDIEPERSIRDVLVFQPPVEKATEAILSLPGEAVGDRRSEARFRIPRNLIKAANSP